MTADDRRDRLASARLYLIATRQPGDDGAALTAVIGRAVSGGVQMVQLRMKGADTAERRAWAGLCRAVIGPEPLLVMNDDLDAVFDADGAPLVDGLHLGRHDAAALGGLAAARERLGPDLLLGTSTRTAAEIEAARAGGADHVGFGAMAGTSTKHDTTPADRDELRRCLAAHPDLPLFPIGGLGPHNLGALRTLGVRRAAVGAAILAADDPCSAARRCRDLLSPGPDGP